jgi:ribose transport system substrate-binding protein
MMVGEREARRPRLGRGRNRLKLATGLSVALGLAVLAGCSSSGSGSAASGSAGGGSAASGSAAGNSSSGKTPVTFVISVRALDNAYAVAWVNGAKGFAQQMGYPASSVKVLQSGANDQAQVTQLQTFLASTSGKVAIAVDPNSNAITQSIVQAVQRDPNAYVTIFWNKPANLWPWNGYSHWVSFINFDGNTSGEKSAQVLFKQMDGKGGIVALQGILNDVPAQQRFAGLQAAVKATPGITLLQQQTANWDETQAFNATKSLLAKYGSEVKGVWAANDEMAIGAQQALKDSNMSNIPVVSASDSIPQVLQSIKAGTGIYASTNPDGYWDGSVGVALAYYAAIGKIDVSSLSHEQRAFYAQAALVDSSNVSQLLASPSPSQYAADWTPTGVFSRSTGAIQP